MLRSIPLLARSDLTSGEQKIIAEQIELTRFALPDDAMAAVHVRDAGLLPGLKPQSGETMMILYPAGPKGIDEHKEFMDRARNGGRPAFWEVPVEIASFVMMFAALLKFFIIGKDEANPVALILRRNAVIVVRNDGLAADLMPASDLSAHDYMEEISGIARDFPGLFEIN